MFWLEICTKIAALSPVIFKIFERCNSGVGCRSKAFQCCKRLCNHANRPRQASFEMGRKIENFCLFRRDWRNCKHLQTFGKLQMAIFTELSFDLDPPRLFAMLIDRKNCFSLQTLSIQCLPKFATVCYFVSHDEKDRNSQFSSLLDVLKIYAIFVCGAPRL